MSGGENQDKELVTVRLNEEIIEAVDEAVDQSTKYESRTDFILESLEKQSNRLETNYDLLLNTAYQTKDNLHKVKSESTEEARYNLGKHIGKLEILKEYEENH